MYKENRTYNRNVNMPNRIDKTAANTTISPMAAPFAMPAPMPSLPPIPVPPFAPTTEVTAAKQAPPSFSLPELKLPESVALPSIPELKLPESVSLPSIADVKLPESIKLPSLPELKLPESVSLPSLPELKLPESVKLPSFTLPELKLPESIPLPSFTLPELKLPEAASLPSFSLDELKFPEIPSTAKLEELFNQALKMPAESKKEAAPAAKATTSATTTSSAAPIAVVSAPQSSSTPPPAKGMPISQTSPQVIPPQIMPPQIIPPQVIPSQMIPPSQIPSGRYAKIRFLNATTHSPISVLIGTGLVVKSLERGEISSYVSVLDGFRTITIASLSTQPVLLRKTLPVKGGEILTIAIIPTAGGVDLLSISDAPCDQHPGSLSCIRMVNLAAASKPLDLLLSDGRVIFTDVSYKDVTPFKRIKPGKYRFFVIHTPYHPMPLTEDIETADATTISANKLPDQCEMKVLLSFVTDIAASKMYTLYILGRDQANMSLEVLIVENKL